MPLQDLADARLIADRILDTLHLPRSPQTEPLEQLVAALSQQDGLLLLDNFEHLVEEGAAMVRALLERLPTLRVLCTSRQHLGLAAEQEFPVPPLPVPVEGSWLKVEGSTKTGSPDPSTLNHQLSTVTQCPSVALFVDRAQAMRPDFQLTPGRLAVVAELCARLDGLPLALELAASRIQVLTPAQMLASLPQRFELLVTRKRDTPPRHRSLRAALDWSYQLLPPELQHLFVHLSVFRGGWTLEAAAAISFHSGRPTDQPPIQDPSDRRAAAGPAVQNPTLDYLEQLRECSLILAEETGVQAFRSPGVQEDGPENRTSHMRYRLLETLREYAAEQLSSLQRAELARRHAVYYLTMAEVVEPLLHGPEQHHWLERLEIEHDNLRAALAWLAADEQGAEEVLRLAAALSFFWAARGHFREGCQWLERALTRGGVSPACRARALSGLAELCMYQGDTERALRAAEESVSLSRSLKDHWALAPSLCLLGWAVKTRGDADRAQALLEEALTLSRQVGNTAALATALFHRGYLTWYEGDPAGATALLAESRVLCAKLGDRFQLISVSAVLGLLHLGQGEYERARGLSVEQLGRCRQVKDRAGIAHALWALGRAECGLGRYERAESLVQESLVIRREIGHQFGIADCLSVLGAMAAARGEYRRARSFQEESLTIRRGLGCQSDIAWSLTGLADVELQDGDPSTARRLLGEGLELFQGLREKRGMATALHGLGRADIAERRFAPARDHFQGSLAIRRELEQQREIAAALGDIAAAVAGLSQPERAARLFGAAAALRDRLGARLSSAEETEHAAQLASLRGALGEAIFAAAWAGGQAMSWQQAVAEALGEREAPAG